MRKPVLVSAWLLFTLLLAPVAAAEDKPAFAVSFDLYDLNDTLVSVSRLLGTPTTTYVLVDFFSTSCEPCKRSMPELAELAKRYAPKGLLVLVVGLPATDDRALAFSALQAFFTPLAPPYSVVFDKYSRVAKQYGVADANGNAKLPQSFLLDRSGAIVARADTFSVIQAALAERLK